MTTTFEPGGPPRFLHQVAGLRKLIETRGVCALLMEPGCGKTATTIDYLSALALKSGREVRVLVLSPVAALDTWVDQPMEYGAAGLPIWAQALGGTVAQRAANIAEGWADRIGQTIATSFRDTQGSVRSGKAALRVGPHPEADRPFLRILSMSLDSFSHKHQVSATVTTTDKLVAAVKKYGPDVIVVDESHRLKGASSNTSRGVARLRDLAPRRILLSGTVMPHSPMDVWAQWRFMNPDAFNFSGKPLSYGRFEARYAVKGGWMGKQVIGFKNLDEMREIMARNAIVVRKVDALDLPPVTDTIVPVHLSPKEQRAYDEMLDQLAVSLDDGSLATAPNRLAQMMRLRQLTSGYVPDPNGGVGRVGRSKTRAVVETVNTTLDAEQRVVVFAHFRQEVADIADAVARPDTEVMQITGDTPAQERERLRKRFGSSEAKRIVLVAQMRTLSLAVNELVTASHAVFASLSERRDDYVQARDRLNRLGQKRPVTFWSVEVPGTVDTVIRKAHAERSSLEQAMLQYIRSS